MKKFISFFVVVLLLAIGCNAKHIEVNDTLPTLPEPISTCSNLSCQAPLPEVIVNKPCSDDMVFIERKDIKFCIDKFEFPNKKGTNPIYAITAFQAETLCTNVGKRLCAYEEWYQACIGTKEYLYSYGSTYIPGFCNDNQTHYIEVDWSKMSTPEWRAYAATLYKGEPSGSRETCKTDEGVYDLPGNVREWTKEPTAPYGYVVPAGYWYGTMSGPPTCTFAIRNHAASFASYEFGTRCCKNTE